MCEGWTRQRSLLDRILADYLVARRARRPPKTQYRRKPLNKMQATPVPSPSHLVGNMYIHGMANGSSRIPDSPESAGFFDVTKKTQKKTVPAASRKRPAARLPPRDFLNTRRIGMVGRAGDQFQRTVMVHRKLRERQPTAVDRLLGNRRSVEAVQAPGIDGPSIERVCGL